MLSCCCFLSWRVLRHQFENRDVGLVSRQLLGVGDHAPTTARQGLAVVLAVPGLARFAVLLLANY